MSVLLGLMLAAGALLTLSPWLWPRRPGATPRPKRRSRLRLGLDAAGLERFTVGAFVAVSTFSGVVASSLVLGVTGIVTLAGLAGVAGASTPAVVVRWRASARQTAARRLWPDVIDHLVASVRSGMALPEALGSLATLGPAQLRPPFEAFARSYSATGRFDVAADELKQRLADPTADRIVETLRMAREVGGTELSSVLRSLAAHLRAEAAVRAELEARQSWVSNAARLGVAAPWIVLAMLSTRPETASSFSSAAGVGLLLCGAVITFVAYRIMRRIGRLPVEQRVFA